MTILLSILGSKALGFFAFLFQEAAKGGEGEFFSGQRRSPRVARAPCNALARTRHQKRKPFGGFLP